jgi:23S rRNA (cytosine1962-C5)-methyltransferase
VSRPGPLESLWPDLDPAWIVHEDGDLIAVDKPEGVPCQAADPAHPDDLPFRLKRFLSARDGGTPYLGIHQRLDQDTSGVVLYAKARRANASLARQMEGRTVDKRYVALVEGWRGGDRRLEHRLARGRDGTSRAVGKRDRKGKRAVTHVRVLRRRGPRALLELRIETGRTHQIRAQLAAVGAPVAGDRLYGGAPAPRLMLHARSLSLEHPVTGAPLTVEAPVPSVFDALLAAPPLPPEGGGRGEGREAGPSTRWRDRLRRAAERRWGLAHREDVTAFRLVNEGGDGLPGLAVDVYDAWLVAHVYDDAVEARLEEVLDALSSLGFAGVYLKRRPRQANVVVDGRDEALSPSAPVRGEPAPEPLTIREHGLPYRVRLGEGLSTGIFLDQRDNRARVRELAEGARVLNLFSYTCAFTVAAAAGGARETLSVDASARLLDWGRDNLEQAGLAGERHRFSQQDVFEALDRLRREGARFDLVCVDPPTYSKTKASRWTSREDWVRLGAACLRLLARGGRLLACSNDRRMRQNELRRHLHEAARRAGVKPSQMKDLPCPGDFPPPVGREPHLKSVLLTT